MKAPAVGTKEDKLGDAFGVSQDAKGIHQLISHGTFLEVIPD